MKWVQCKLPVPFQPYPLALQPHTDRFLTASTLLLWLKAPFSALRLLWSAQHQCPAITDWGKLVGKCSNSFHLGWEDSKLEFCLGSQTRFKKITDLKGCNLLDNAHVSGSLPGLISLPQINFYLNPYVVGCFWEKSRPRQHSWLYLLTERSAYWVYQLTAIVGEILWMPWIIFQFLERAPHSIPWRNLTKL